MTTPYPPFRIIALAKENESPENPGGLEKRVALAPPEVATLVDSGAEVFVEEGAGAGIDIPDADYMSAGARLQPASEIYKNKDLIIKFKGPALASIEDMTEGTTFFAWHISTLILIAPNCWKTNTSTSLPWKKSSNRPK